MKSHKKLNEVLFILMIIAVVLVLFSIRGAVLTKVEGQVEPPATAAGPELTILSEDETGITLKIDFPDFLTSKIQVFDIVFDVLEIPNTGKTGEIGKPALPKYGTMLSLPSDVTVDSAYMQVIETESETYNDYFVYPVQEPAPDQIAYPDGPWPPFPTPPFTMDEVFYETDQLYPSVIIDQDPAGTLRDVRVVPLRFTAFRHNPVTRELIFYSSITVRIDYFQGPVLLKSNRVESSPHFDGIYSTLLNYKQPPVENLVTELKSSGCEFLIISDPGLVDAANTLAARRNAQGLSTLVRTTTNTGNTAAQIKAYIQNAYDTWNPRPSYLLLLGDAELIPTFYRTVHSDAGLYYPVNFHTGTDLYYSIMNGPEVSPPYYDEYWAPDLFYGRIPVDTLAQANDVINKIIEYEDNQWICGETMALGSGYFQDGWLNVFDGYEDRRFILTLEEIRGFLDGEGFQMERLYTTDPNIDPNYYNNGIYDLGLPLPNDLKRPTYPWNADTADITNSINNGRFLVIHRDHGGSRNRSVLTVEGWGDPEYEDTDVAGLSNGDHLTVVFSINCETGWFDGETDENTTQSFESLCEAFLRESDGGAVGVIGATRISSSGWNDDLVKGCVDAIWPNFLTPDGPGSPQLRMGEVLHYGKLYMLNHGSGWPWPMEKQQYEIFHYFGDPTMALKIPVNEPPIAAPNGPYNGIEGSPVVFDGSGSYDSCHSIILYEWDLDGDNVFETTGINPSHTWCDDYTGIVTLRVTDSLGATDTASTSITVHNVTPTVDAGPDQTVNEGDIVQFNGSFTDPGCDTWIYEWDFGDGSPMVTGTLTPTHAYGDNGVYTVTLTVIDDDGGAGSDTLTVSVNNVAPIAVIDSMDQPNPQFILPIVHILTFNGSFTDPGWLDTHTSTWDFGDGNIVNGTLNGTLTEENEEPDATGTTSAEHTYSAPGNYTVTLTVTDDDNGTGTDMMQVTVIDAEEAKHDINDYIQNLPDYAFKKPANQRKDAFANKFNAIDNILDTGNYQGAINKLQNDIRSKCDGFVDGNPNDDWITAQNAQEEICMKIDDLVAYLEYLSIAETQKASGSSNQGSKANQSNNGNGNKFLLGNNLIFNPLLQEYSLFLPLLPLVNDINSLNNRKLISLNNGFNSMNVNIPQLQYFTNGYVTNGYLLGNHWGWNMGYYKDGNPISGFSFPFSNSFLPYGNFNTFIIDEHLWSPIH